MRTSTQEALSRAFGVALGAGERRTDGTHIGVEHEYSVLEAGQPVDWRRLIDDAPIEGRCLDPGDPRARRCSWGGVITADGKEAEIASPPIRAGAGFTVQAAGWSRLGEAALQDALPPEASLMGYSTHLNVSVDDRRTVVASRRFARSFAPALMLLMDRPTSPGLLVRPRPGRLELCGEHVSGAHLRAAMALATGGAIVCARRPRDLRELPRVALELVPATGRYGTFVARRACGTDLYADGRTTVLRTRRGTVLAQRHLEHAWTVARSCLEATASATELEVVDRIVRGDLPLPMEAGSTPPVDDVSGVDPGPWADVMTKWQRPGFRAEVTIATWHVLVVDLISADGRRAVAAVPHGHVAAFVAAMNRGAADDLIREYLQSPPSGRTMGAADRGSVGMYDSLESPSDLLLRERAPNGWRRLRSGGPGGGDRPGKQESSHQPPRVPRKVLVGAGAAAALVIAGAVAALAGGGSDRDVGTVAPRDAGVTTVDPGQPGASSSTTFPARLPLDIDACSVLSEPQVVAFANDTGGEFRAVGPIRRARLEFFQAAHGGGTGTSDTDFEKYCSYVFRMDTPGGSIEGPAQDGVEINILRIDPALDARLDGEICSSTAVGEQLYAIGDYADGHLGSGHVRVDDVCASVAYDGPVSSDGDEPAASLPDLLETLAAAIEDA